VRDSPSEHVPPLSGEKYAGVVVSSDFKPNRQSMSWR
jgi:hypothetical protein